MSKFQKRLVIITIVVLLLIIALAIVIWRQKKVWQSELENITTVEEHTAEVKDEQNAREDNIKEATTTNIGRDIIEEVLPGSDLVEFNLPGEILNKDHLTDKFISPAYNRSGIIKQVIYPQNKFIFVDDSLGKEKIYSVKVDQNTKISLDILEDIFIDKQAEDPLETKRYIREGDFDELQVNDNIRVRARDVIKDNSFTADEIVVKRTIITYQNK